VQIDVTREKPAVGNRNFRSLITTHAGKRLVDQDLKMPVRTVNLDGESLRRP
jgi:hypothetical protein